MNIKPRTRTLITHREIAEACSIDTETLRDWVAKGVWPEPHAVIERTWFYPASAFAHWIETGRWPEGTKFKRGEGAGRTRDH